MAVLEHSNLSVQAARSLFAPACTYLDAASYGIPPAPGWDAFERAASEWRGGEVPFSVWDESVGRARAAWARLVGVDPGDVAVGSTVAGLCAVVAGSLPAGTRVLAPREDFTSLLFPFLAAPGLEVTLVALDELADAIDSRTDVVAFSLVQSADGRVADVDSLLAAASHHGARTVIDATQGCGWLPFDAARADAVICGGYKWLLGPRGTAFMSLGEDFAATLRPAQANWYAGEDPMEALYGGPLRLAADARRFDVSPAWLSWAGAAPAIELLLELGVHAIHAYDLALANRFRAGLGMAPGDSAIVSIELPPGADDRLAAAGVRASVRAGRARFSFHLWVSEAGVDRALDSIAG